VLIGDGETQDSECRESPKEISEPEATFQAASADMFHVGSRVFQIKNLKRTNARKLPRCYLKAYSHCTS